MISGRIEVPDRYGTRISGPHHGGHGHGGHGHGGREFRRDIDVVPVEYMADEASVYQSANVCVLTANVNAEIATVLRARGWVDRFYVGPGGKRGPAALCPPGVEPTPVLSGFQPGRMVISEIGRLDHIGDLRLASNAAVTVQVYVQDSSGKPFPGIPIKVVNPNGDGSSGTTDERGGALITSGVDALTDELTVNAALPEGTQTRVYNPAQDAGMVVGFKSTQSASIFLSPVELSLVGGAALLGALGMGFKSLWLGLGGGVLGMAAIASKVARS